MKVTNKMIIQWLTEDFNKNGEHIVKLGSDIHENCEVANYNVKDNIGYFNC